MPSDRPDKNSNEILPRIRAFPTTTMLLVSIIGLGLLTVLASVYEPIGLFVRTYFGSEDILFPSFVGLVAILVISQFYVRFTTEYSPDRTSEATDYLHPDVRQRLRTIARAEAEKTFVELSPAENGTAEQTISRLKEAVESTIADHTDEVVVEQIRNRLLERFGNDPVGNHFQRMISEIELARDNTVKKANQNLFFGLIFAIISIALLLYLVLDKELAASLTDVTAATATLYLRSTVAIFGGVFSFFFLQLYRTGVNERKFYQNEITNLSSKHAAIMLAQGEDDRSILKPLVDSLAKTERNFVLKKGETTTAIETAKIDKSFLEQFLKSVGKQSN